MRKSVFKKILLFAAASVLLIASGCSATGANNDSGNGDKAVVLKLAHFFPATHPAEKELILPWAEAIAEATDGKVKIESYPGETLLKANDIYDGVVDGIAELGLSCFAYTRGHFPVLEVFELPGITYRSSEIASKTAWEGIKKLNPTEIQDTKLMMVLTTGSGDLFTKVPVRGKDDLQGLEIRATGLSAKTLEMLGAVPVAMPQSDAYESLSKGVVQGNLSPIEVLQGWRHAEVTDYLTLTPFLYNTLFFVTMNLDVWNSFSPDIQEAIELVNEEYFNKVAAGLWDKQNKAALDWAVGEMGMEVITLPDEEKELWIDIIKPIQEDFVESMNAKGFQGREILDTVKGLAERFDAELM
ncbi:MAG TPA: TRAP transporter substrate-binding protein [Clostridia bacterium]|nr:TRAP transporter substrate-binding protein [Clostridia bacterium]